VSRDGDAIAGIFQDVFLESVFVRSTFRRGFVFSQGCIAKSGDFIVVQVLGINERNFQRGGHQPIRPAAFQSTGSVHEAFERTRVLDIIDERALDRECLSQSLVSHGLNMNIVLFNSIETWMSKHVDASSGVLINVGSRDFTEPRIEESIRALLSRHPDLPVIILSDNHDLRQVLRALELGVRGFIPSAVGIAVCVKAISLALSGGIFISTESLPELRRLMSVADQQERKRAEIFTSREEDVIAMLKLGKANKIIAYKLDLRESTVKVHIRNIMKKLSVRNRTEVIFKLNELFD
jgi:DNA-binding NarL/FixJ family response regulator